MRQDVHRTSAQLLDEGPPDAVQHGVAADQHGDTATGVSGEETAGLSGEGQGMRSPRHAAGSSVR
ncbi:hypothetical protein SHJG_1319 [Streptomyces hygroscopicus subsp. jinggangensis 5008]|nr:hypothetical protein SHJG_1319 [Streptomyces hygroscopicus subsp. jinggangensis 5008]AGF60819.1 hypothetical protein SHJGH_1153 [Streptomyces hygroscopicus subsp. jinggangensis TL01]